MRPFAKNNELALGTNVTDHASPHPAVWAFKLSEHNFVIFRMNDAGKFRLDIDRPIWSMSNKWMTWRVHHRPILIRETEGNVKSFKRDWLMAERLFAFWLFPSSGLEAALLNRCNLTSNAKGFSPLDWTPPTRGRQNSVSVNFPQLIAPLRRHATQSAKLGGLNVTFKPSWYRFGNQRSFPCRPQRSLLHR